mgnify:CR=1 FL=1
MLNVGDAVRIIQDVPGRNSEWWIFVEPMDEYCGKDAVVEGVVTQTYGRVSYTGYLLDVDDKNFIWVEAWLTPIESFDPPTKEEFDTEFDKLLM